MAARRDWVDLSKYRRCFEQLQALAYQNIMVDQVSVRILGIHYMDYDVNWTVKTHRHSFFELHYVTEGDVLTKLKGIEHRIPAGSFYLMPPGTFHSHRQDAGTGHIGFALRWEFIGDYEHSFSESGEMDKLCRLLMKVPTDPVQDDSTLWTQMLRLLNLAGRGSRILPLKLAFCQLIAVLSEFYRKKKPNMPYKADMAMENHTIIEVLRFIEDNYYQDIGIEDIADFIHVSDSHIRRLFKKHTGDTFTQHLNKVRMAKAQLLLKCTQKTIRQIAGEVGYNNEYYFSNSFKKSFGISPKDYRKDNSRLAE